MITKPIDFKSLLIIIFLLLSTCIISQNLSNKQDWPYFKKSNHKIGSFNPYNFGYVLKNLSFTSKASLRVIGIEKYTWDFSIDFNCDVVGYKYLGVTYSKKELINIMGINKLAINPVLKDVKISFSNRGTFFNKYINLGNLNYGNIKYNKGDEKNSFNLEVKIIGNKRDLFLEGKIKRFLAKQEKEKNKKNDTKKIKSNSKTVEKIDKSQKKLDEDAENAAVRRRLAKRRKEAQDKKLKADLNKIKKNTTTVVTGISNGLINGSISYVRGGIGIRADEDSNSFSLSSPSNMTYEIGIEGFYMGFGLPESNYDETSGFSWLAGIDYFFYEGYEGFNVDFGLNAEFGMGNMDTTDYDDKYNTNYTEDAIFYSFGAQIMLGKVLYVSYNYGFYSGDYKESYSNNKSSISKKGSGNFTKIGVGLALSF